MQEKHEKLPRRFSPAAFHASNNDLQQISLLELANALQHSAKRVLEAVVQGYEFHPTYGGSC
jgi:hypothetical protein